MDASVLIALALSLNSPTLQEPPKQAVTVTPGVAADPAATRAFAELVAAHDEWRLAAYPEYALRRGIESRAGELTDTSLAGIHKRQAWLVDFLELVRKVDAAKLSHADARDYFLFRRDLELAAAHRHHP
jgi:uncharacterized protein (DUF885 family)